MKIYYLDFHKLYSVTEKEDRITVRKAMTKTLRDEIMTKRLNSICLPQKYVGLKQKGIDIYEKESSIRGISYWHVYITNPFDKTKVCSLLSQVKYQLYTERVGGSSPSSPTITDYKYESPIES